MTLVALIGAKGLYLLFAWLFSAAAGSWLSERKGYGERLGVALGLLFSGVGLLIVLVLPRPPRSRWKDEGPVPRRHRGGQAPRTASTGSGFTPSASASAVPRSLTIGTSISSASSQVAKTASPKSPRRVTSARWTSPSGTWTSGRGRPLARATARAISS